MINTFREVLGQLSSIVIDDLVRFASQSNFLLIFLSSQNTLGSLQKSLSRHFDVILDESHLWSNYNEYAIRCANEICFSF